MNTSLMNCQNVKLAEDRTDTNVVHNGTASYNHTTSSIMRRYTAHISELLYSSGGGDGGGYLFLGLFLVLAAGVALLVLTGEFLPTSGSRSPSSV